MDAVAVNGNAIKACADNGRCRQYCRYNVAVIVVAKKSFTGTLLPSVCCHINAMLLQMAFKRAVMSANSPVDTV